MRAWSSYRDQAKTYLSRRRWAPRSEWLQGKQRSRPKNSRRSQPALRVSDDNDGATQATRDYLASLTMVPDVVL